MASMSPRLSVGARTFVSIIFHTEFWRTPRSESLIASRMWPSDQMSTRSIAMPG